MHAALLVTFSRHILLYSSCIILRPDMHRGDQRQPRSPRRQATETLAGDTRSHEHVWTAGPSHPHPAQTRAFTSLPREEAHFQTSSHILESLQSLLQTFCHRHTQLGVHANRKVTYASQAYFWIPYTRSPGWNATRSGKPSYGQSSPDSMKNSHLAHNFLENTVLLVICTFLI